MAEARSFRAESSHLQEFAIGNAAELDQKFFQYRIVISIDGWVLGARQ